MHDAHWCKSNVDKFHEQLDGLGASVAGLSRLLADAQAAWHDRAGRELSSRSLRPFEEGSAEVKRFLGGQAEQLGAATAAMLAAAEPALRSHRAMESAAQHRDRCHQESLGCHHQADVSLQHQAMALEQAESARGMLASIG
jgi:hypothetical protein